MDEQFVIILNGYTYASAAHCDVPHHKQLLYLGRVFSCFDIGHSNASREEVPVENK